MERGRTWHQWELKQEFLDYSFVLSLFTFVMGSRHRTPLFDNTLCVQRKYILIHFSPSCCMRKGLGYRKLTWARFQLSQTWIFKGDKAVISTPRHAIERLGQWDTKRWQRRTNLWSVLDGAWDGKMRLKLRYQHMTNTVFCSERLSIKNMQWV